jgi:hypothetical protein
VKVERRTVLLGVAAVGAVAAAVAVTTVGHHSTGSRPHKDVTRYIDKVNALQKQMHAPLARVMLAYASFGRGRSRRPSATQLAAAAATLARLDRGLAALACPPEAYKLRRRLLQLVGREAEITREVQALARFAPRYVTTLGGMHAANLRLDSRLKKIKVPTPRVLRGTKKAVARAQRVFRAKAQQAAVAQAAAVDEYDSSVAHVLSGLVRLHPPPALAPEFRAQVAALHEVTAAGAILANRLRSARRGDIAALSRRFSLASRAAATLAVQRAQIAAIRAYNTRARQVGAAAGAVQAELARLQRDLP